MAKYKEEGSICNTYMQPPSFLFLEPIDLGSLISTYLIHCLFITFPFIVFIMSEELSKNFETLQLHAGYVCLGSDDRRIACLSSFLQNSCN